MRKLIGLAAAVIAGAVLTGAAPTPRPALAYHVVEGDNDNLFVRDGSVAAHVVLRSGLKPRILVAFPAGNSGTGLWFEPIARRATWRVEAGPVPVSTTDPRGRPLHGVRVTASIDAPRLVPAQALLTSVRYLRDYQAVGRFPPEVAVPAVATGQSIVWARDRIDGAPGYRLALRIVEGRRAAGAIVAGPRGRIAVEVTALGGDTPLTPIPVAELLNARAAADPAARHALEFLSYREKFLAGSWRFNTYFGRDTLMSLRLLMPALRPAAIEAGLSSVLARLGRGEVAHEEGIGEFAVIANRTQGRGANDRPELDYKMVDDEYMLAPVAAHYLLDTAGRTAARRYLAQPIAHETRRGEALTVGGLLAENLRHVVERGRGFADAPVRANLIAIDPAFKAGQWRDSDDGIGGGRYPYDVNAVFVPAALDAAARLFASGLLDAVLTADDRAAFARAEAMAAVWRREAGPMFAVSRPAAEARPAIEAYARTLGVPAAPALAALGRAPLDFHAIALDATGAPVPIIHSDEGFALLFGEPTAAELDTYVTTILRPFPAGLMTDIGLLVANPALAGAAAQARFTPGAYHGAVVWSWQQALLAAGLERQLARRDLPRATRAGLTSAQARLWRAIAAARAFGNSELWSWDYAGGRYRIVAFGAGKADVDESNAAQLWSTVYLAVRPPVSPRGSQ